ncbi:MAG TPA: hypothetical protein VK548_26750 [Candidatus Acidoferrum sp.]|nr:hypothetical protein [Candidatus Acidoferrum sp.]
MRSHVKGLLFGVSMLMGLMWVSEAAAFVPSGGSRLLMYFSNKSFVSGAGNNTGFTVALITNTDNSVASKVAVKYYRGSDCASTAATIFDIAAGETLRFDTSSTAAAIQEGVIEAYFVNGAGQPVRNDAGVGSTIVVDFLLPGVARIPAAVLHSDDRVGTKNSLIADNGDGTTFAPLLLSAQFVDPAIVTTRLALFSPGTVPGTSGADTTASINFRLPNGGGAATTTLDFQCGRTATLASVRGLSAAGFLAAYPAGGVVAPTVDGQPKGLVGWTIETIQITSPTVNLLFGTKLEGIGTASLDAHP